MITACTALHKSSIISHRGWCLACAGGPSFSQLASCAHPLIELSIWSPPIVCASSQVCFSELVDETLTTPCTYCEVAFLRLFSHEVGPGWCWFISFMINHLCVMGLSSILVAWGENEVTHD